MKFPGCRIVRNEVGDILISMSDNIVRIIPFILSRQKPGQADDKASNEEKHLYSILAGTILYLAQTVLTQGCFVASKIRKRLRSFLFLIPLKQAA